MADNFGLKIGLEGEKEFKKALSEINQSFKVLGSEMKLVESQFDKNDTSVQALTARNEVLQKSIDTQKSKIETLKQALENSAKSFGENDKRTQSWQIQLNQAQAELNKMERELQGNNKALCEADKGFDKAEKSADEFGDEVEKAGKQADDSSGKFEALGGVCKAVGATIATAFAAVSAAAIAAGKALVDMTKEGAKYADSVLTESQVTGIATDKLQEYMYAAELVDVSTDTLTKSMAKQIKSMKSAADGSKSYVEAYEQLGVSVTDANGNLRDSDTVYWELIDALGKLENETERDALGMTLLGKSAQELNPLIIAGADRMHELGKQAQEAEYVIGEDMLKAYGNLDDQMQYLTVGATAAKNALGTILLPILTDLATDGVSLLGEFTNGVKNANGDLSKITDVFGDILPKVLDVIMQYVPVLLDLITTVVTSLGKAIVNNLDSLIDAASKIVLTILNALIKALPKVTEGALKLVMTLAKGILANLPKIVEVAAQVITSLALGIADSLPELIPTIVEVILQICQTIVDSLPYVLDAVLQIIMGLVQGILDSIYGSYDSENGNTGWRLNLNEISISNYSSAYSGVKLLPYYKKRTSSTAMSQSTVYEGAITTVNDTYYDADSSRTIRTATPFIIGVPREYADSPYAPFFEWGAYARFVNYQTAELVYDSAYSGNWQLRNVSGSTYSLTTLIPYLYALYPKKFYFWTYTSSLGGDQWASISSSTHGLSSVTGAIAIPRATSSSLSGYPYNGCLCVRISGTTVYVGNDNGNVNGGFYCLIFGS